jgi:hypothetical protein
MAYTAAIREQTHTANIDSDGRPVLTYREGWLLKDDSSSWVGVQQARLNFTTATGITPGSVYSDYAFATCRSITPTRLQTRAPWQRWRIDVEFSTATSEKDEEDPSLRRWIRGVTTSTQTRHIFRDINDKLIVDAAGSPFDGGVPVDVVLTTYTWKHNVDWSVYDTDSVGLLSGCINSDSFLGKDPYTLKLTYAAEEQWEGKYHFAAETYTAIYDPYGWKPKPANAGLFYLDAGERIRIKDDKGRDVVEPEPLTLAGAVVPVANRPADCTFIEVDYYREIEFAALNLPTA